MDVFLQDSSSVFVQTARRSRIATALASMELDQCKLFLHDTHPKLEMHISKKVEFHRVKRGAPAGLHDLVIIDLYEVYRRNP